MRFVIPLNLYQSQLAQNVDDLAFVAQGTCIRVQAHVAYDFASQVLACSGLKPPILRLRVQCDTNCAMSACLLLIPINF